MYVSNESISVNPRDNLRGIDFMPISGEKTEALSRLVSSEVS